MGVDEHGRFKGHLKATGVRPKFAEKLADLGIRLGQEVFTPGGLRPEGGQPVVRRTRLHATSASGVGRSRSSRCCITVLLGGTARAGSSNEPDVFVRAVDATKPASTAVGFVSTAAAMSRAATLTQNGKQVQASAPLPLPDSTPMAIAFVFDVSEPMDSSGALAAAKDEAKQWLRGLNAGERTGRKLRRVLRRPDRRAAAGLHERHQPRHRRHRQGRTGQHRGRQEVDRAVVGHPAGR